jgi:hypothetical protein
MLNLTEQPFIAVHSRLRVNVKPALNSDYERISVALGDLQGAAF